LLGIPLPTNDPLPTTEAFTTPAPTTTSTTLSPTTTGQVTTSTPSRAPGAPENLKARIISETAIELSWDPPTYTGGQILSYTIFITFTSGSGK